jgi:hypothetical protein
MKVTTSKSIIILTSLSLSFGSAPYLTNFGTTWTNSSSKSLSKNSCCIIQLKLVRKKKIETEIGSGFNFSRFYILHHANKENVMRFCLARNYVFDFRFEDQLKFF